MQLIYLHENNVENHGSKIRDVRNMKLLVKKIVAV